VLEKLPPDVRVEDYGIRSLHLAYELMEGRYDTTILVDTLSRGRPPGTLFVMEPDLKSFHGRGAADAHTMSPAAVLGYLSSLGGAPGRVLVVGCEPASLEEGMGLSPAVESAVPEAVKLVLEWIERESKGASDVSGDPRPNRATVSG
jgi:hydrogenase maturation protease